VKALYFFPLACKIFCIHFHNYVLYCMFVSYTCWLLRQQSSNTYFVTSKKTIRLQPATQFHLGILNANDDHGNNNNSSENVQEELRRIWKLSAVYVVPFVLSTTGIIPNKLQNCLKLVSLHPDIYICVCVCVCVCVSVSSTTTR
jgi:hypothetical protein